MGLLSAYLYGVAHLYFNDKGEMVGSGTDGVKSYIAKKG